TQATTGFVWEPVPGVSIGADWWWIDKDDVIASLTPDQVLEHYDVYGASNVVRGPATAANPALPGPIRTILSYNQNLGNLTTSGVDIALRARTDATAWGRL